MRYIMRILYGTTNQAKLESMKRITKSLDLEIIGLNDLQQPIPKVDESGKSPLENAELKARAYFNAFSMPVFSCDSGLYFEQVEEKYQPGTHIRRVNGKELSDEEMIEYYSNLAKMHDNQLLGRYRNAICLVLNENTCFSSMDEMLATEPFKLVSVAHPKRVKGYPLDSLSVDIHSGKYYYDMQEKSVDQSAIEQGFTEFFQKVLSNIEKG